MPSRHVVFGWLCYIHAVDEFDERDEGLLDIFACLGRCFHHLDAQSLACFHDIVWCELTLALEITLVADEDDRELVLWLFLAG